MVHEFFEREAVAACLTYDGLHFGAQALHQEGGVGALVVQEVGA